MSCCSIPTGSRNKRIYIQVRQRTPDGQGGWTEEFLNDPSGYVWAQVKVRPGYETMNAERVTPITLFSAYVPFRGDSYGAPYYKAAETKIIMDGREYAVISCTDKDMASRLLEFTLREGSAT